jgi:hypothetical protein
MRFKAGIVRRFVVGLAVGLLAGAVGLGAAGRFRIEVYGGLTLMNPRDFNLLAKAEEKYNYIFFQERLIGTNGYFTNDFATIGKALPAGLRLRYGVSRRFDVSVDVEGFRKAETTNVSGTFSYGSGWTITESKAYSPFRLGLKAVSVTGGLQLKIPAGPSTELEVGMAVGWAWARFDFLSSWTAGLDLTEDGEVISSSVDGGTLEGNGKGRAPVAKLMVRLNRALGRRLGVFVETGAVYCRMKSLSGGGRETHVSVPGESVWEGPWGIKREVIEMPYDSVTVFVPTNYWEGWVGGQRERDFVLDISGLRLVFGLYLKF